MRSFVSLLPLGLGLMPVALGNLDGVSSNFNVEIPRGLNRDEGYDHREALFGVPQYGGEIAEKVYYADSTLCDDPVDKRKGYPCTYDSTGACEPWQSPFILMVDRGDCTFVSKVRRAQQAGASAVLIADNVCTCGNFNTSPQECTMDPGLQCEQNEPIMADDGSGNDVSIPSFLLFKQDADAIKTVLKDQNGIVQVKLQWGIPAPDDRVEWELWSNPVEVVSKNFQKTFYPDVAALGASQQFTPHFYIFDGVQNGCHSNAANCGSLCVNQGRYCAVDPDSDLERGISGGDVVVESLRRLCIWQHHGQDGVGEKYWRYVNYFLDNCDTETSFPTSANSACALAGLSAAGIDSSQVDQCMFDSGGTTADNVNQLLQGEIDAKAERGIVVIPTVYVNTVVMRGSISDQTVFSTICSGFLDGTSPEICRQCANCFDVTGCVSAGGVCGGSSPGGGGGGEKKDGISVGTLFLSLFLTVGVMGAGGFMYYKRTQREMRDQVRGILAEYMPLDDGAEGGAQMTARSGNNVAQI